VALYVIFTLIWHAFLTDRCAWAQLGWISIATWYAAYILRLRLKFYTSYITRRVVVYSPQIYENFNLKSGEGLSIAFVVIWLIGDLCNIVGASIAGLLPTMIILAAYVRRPFLLRNFIHVTAIDVSLDSTPFAIRSFSFRYTIIGG